MGRTHHLKETLPQNLRESSGVDAEFVVLNYNSPDDLHDWITTDPEMQKYIKSGRLRYGRTTEPEHFHMSHAKNMAHRMATGDVLCNVDADNSIGVGFSAFLEAQFSKDMNIVMNPSHGVSRHFPPEERGFFGRIAISAGNFHLIGGYDEEFQGWGGEDNDLIRRAKANGVEHLRFENMKYLGVICHTNVERAENMKNADDVLEAIDFSQNHESVLTKILHRAEALKKPIIANSKNGYGIGRVEMEGDGNRDLMFGKVTGSSLSTFNTCAMGLPSMIRDRIAPRVVSDENEFSLSDESESCVLDESEVGLSDDSESDNDYEPS